MSDFSIVKELIREKLDPMMLLDYYHIDIPDRHSYYGKVRCACPIHGGDQPTAFSFDLGSKMFSCFTRHCGESPKDWYFQPKDGSRAPRDLFLFIKLMEEKKADDEGRRGFTCSFWKALQVASEISGVPVDESTFVYNKEMTDKLENQRWMRQMTKLTAEVEMEEFDEEEVDVFRAQLPLCEDYIHTRGFSEDLLDFFEIGFSAEGVDEPWKSRKKNFPGRIIFPIRCDKGRLVGWSGRLTTDDKVLTKLFHKYMHKVDFDKGFVLYNYHNAKEFIKESNELILVEGPWDVMRLWSYGIYNVVAVMGSSLTPEQMSLAVSSAFKIYIWLDSDKAGDEGSMRICEQVMRYSETYVVRAKGGKDPDDLRFEQAWEALAHAKKYMPKEAVRR